MTTLQAVDRLDIQVLVDNVTDSLSSWSVFAHGCFRPFHCL